MHVIGNEDGEFQKMDSGNKSDKQEALKNGGKPLQIEAKGICGSGIIDLIAELFLERLDSTSVWKVSPEKSPLIQKKEGQWCVEYAPGLHFYQKDIDEFIRTKSAAHTMVEIMLRESGLEALTRQNGSMWQGLLESMYPRSLPLPSACIRIWTGTTL